MPAANAANITHKEIIFSIGKTYREGMSDEELYEATMGTWKLEPEIRNQVEFAMAVYHRTIREVYQIEKWNPAGTHKYKTRTFKEPHTNKWEFEGKVAYKVRDIYIGKPLPGSLRIRRDGVGHISY